MYAETGLLYPYFQNFSPDVEQFDEICHSEKPISSMDTVIPTSTISDYDLGGEGDLFKAPEPIIEEPIMGLDPVTAAISMMSYGEDIPVIQPKDLKTDPLLSEVFYDCRRDLLERTSVETPVSEVLDLKPAFMMTNEMQIEGETLTDLPFLKSVSSGCLSSMDWVSGASMRPNFLDFSDLDFGAANGMRRAFSEGDIKTLGNGNVSIVSSPLQQPLVIGNCTSEDRLQKLSRYRNKKSRRNFGRKIKYACRKALADSQPRIRGRFAKTEETEFLKKQ